MDETLAQPDRQRVPVDRATPDETPLTRAPSNHQIQLFIDRSGAGVNWRLLAANHREFGRGVTPFADQFACRAALVAVRAEPDRLIARPRPAAMGRWSWELNFDGVAIARSSRVFDRLIRCEQVLQSLVHNVCNAVIAEVVVDMSGRRVSSDRLLRLREQS